VAAIPKALTIEQTLQVRLVSLPRSRSRIGSG
jgi:hypothetical protein